MWGSGRGAYNHFYRGINASIFLPWIVFHFCSAIKLTDMLKGITWGQFGVFILVLAAVYYLYVGLRFYGYEILERFGISRSGPAGLGTGLGGGSGRKAVRDAGSVDNTDQTELFERGDKVAEGNDFFKMMQQAIGV